MTSDSTELEILRSDKLGRDIESSRLYIRFGGRGLYLQICADLRGFERLIHYPFRHSRESGNLER